MKYFLLAFSLFSFSSIAQIGELQASLKEVITDSTRFEIQSQIFRIAIYRDIDSSYECLKNQQSILENGDLEKETAAKFKMDYYVHLGVFYSKKGETDRALSYYQTAKETAVKNNWDKEEATIINNMANIYYQKGEYPMALESYLESLTIRRKAEDTLGIGMSLGNIGLIYEVQEDYENAIKHYQLAQEKFVELQRKQHVSWTYRVIGTAYMEMEKFEKAIFNLKKSRDLCQEIGDESGKNYCNLNLGVVHTDWYIEKEDPALLDTADFYLEQLGDDLQDKRLHVNALNSKARVFNYRGEYALGLETIQSSLELLKNLDMNNELKDAYEIQSDALAGLGKFKEAYEAHVLFKTLSDEVFNIEKENEMGRKQASYEYEERLTLEKIKRKNDRKIFNYQSRQRQLVVVIIILSFIISIIIFVFFYRRRVRENSQLKYEKQAILKEYESLEKAYSVILEKLESIQLKSKKESDQANLPSWVKKLSKREMEVLSCLSIGMTDKEIQDKLCISVTTVRTHCQRIYSKLLVKNRAEAANVVREYGILT